MPHCQRHELFILLYLLRQSVWHNVFSVVWLTGRQKEVRSRKRQDYGNCLSWEVGLQGLWQESDLGPSWWNKFVLHLGLNWCSEAKVRWLEASLWSFPAAVLLRDRWFLECDSPSGLEAGYWQVVGRREQESNSRKLRCFSNLIITIGVQKQEGTLRRILCISKTWYRFLTPRK